MEKFVDVNGKEIKIGDKVFPANGEGCLLLIISRAYVSDFETECLFGQQVEDPLAFSPLTPENLSKNWIKVEDENEIAEIYHLDKKQVTNTFNLTNKQEVQ